MEEEGKMTSFSAALKKEVCDFEKTYQPYRQKYPFVPYRYGNRFLLLQRYMAYGHSLPGDEVADGRISAQRRLGNSCQCRIYAAFQS